VLGLAPYPDGDLEPHPIDGAAVSEQ